MNAVASLDTIQLFDRRATPMNVPSMVASMTPMMDTIMVFVRAARKAYRKVLDGLYGMNECPMGV